MSKIKFPRQHPRSIGVSPTTYQRGKTALGKGSEELKQDVKEGKKTLSAAYDEVKGKDNKLKKQATDILMLPEDKFQAMKDVIDSAITANDKQVVLRHDKRRVISVGKEIEISTA